MLRRFIERPVLSTVVSIIIVILGILGLLSLPIEQYPNIAPPTIRVSANYTGANADVVLRSVVIPLEEQINGVENMTYMNSTASNDGSASIDVYFKQGTNPDIDAVNVQNKVSRATSKLPSSVVKSGVTTSKRQNSTLMMFSVYNKSPHSRFDETFLQNYVKINLLPQIQRVPGVGDVSIMGSKDYSMRVWLKPDVMATYGLTPDDVNNALNDQSLEAAPGKLGENNNQAFEYVMKYKGRLKTQAEYENIVVRANADGSVLRLKDVARIELGSDSYSIISSTMNSPAANVVVNQSPGSNARDVTNQVKKVLQDASVSFPSGVTYRLLVDGNDFLDSSIKKVVRTLCEAFFLVVIVVFLFLGDFRSTIIPAISVPVAIIGTFFFLNLFGYTINMLTLFALVLAIGIVVDDAIVVVEAVHAKLDAGAKNAKAATVAAMDEIAGAIVSITLVMSAVFIPVTFLTGSTGAFYRQFGITLAIAIIISAVNALTLSPALCALFLKAHEQEGPTLSLLQRFNIAFNTAFQSTVQKYRRGIAFVTSKRGLVPIGILVFIGILFIMIKITPTGFIPAEDNGTIYVDVGLPPASSLMRTQAVLQEIDRYAANIKEIQTRSINVGRGMFSGKGSSYGMLTFRLTNWSQREGKGQDLKSIIEKLRKKTAHIREAKIVFFSPPMVSGFSFSDGFDLKLQDKTGGDIIKFDQVSKDFLAALTKRPEIKYAATPFDTKFPQYMVNVDAAKCKQSGIDVSTILSTLQGYIGGVYAADFNLFGKQYRVMMQAEPKYRGNPESLNGIYVKTGSGAMAPISEFVSLNKTYGPDNISRYNMYNAISISGNSADGYSSGDAIRAVQQVAAQELPAGYGYEFSGLTREELASGGQAILIFILSFIFVYFLLCAQYESYILPFSILLSLPFGITGSFLFAKLLGVSNNIYLQISLIMLIGLLSKNAILIVEFALQRRRHGMPIVKAAIEGAAARLRPILMTSFAFIFGLMPLALSSGLGANGNRSIGIGAAGGMLVGTLLGIFVIPTLFVIFQSLQEKVSRKPAIKLEEADKGEEIVNQDV
ncbi:MAG: efflux RND transporter permease subunit [Bacteroidota bacterium]|nr:efflux RND transporter permease subunit [Bacteroidota bacterium]MDP4226955.1 efflux RND transporter permease subunit [Bacteroidota bacterium]MDP4274358.1 efflux RND transporter permease subunit [Bacteroidota bacterium]